MYVCMYVCMYCMYVCKYICMYVCMYVCIYACMHECLHPLLITVLSDFNENIDPSKRALSFSLPPPAFSSLLRIDCIRAIHIHIQYNIVTYRCLYPYTIVTHFPGVYLNWLYSVGIQYILHAFMYLPLPFLQKLKFRE
jgi:hypothetical protein